MLLENILCSILIFIIAVSLFIDGLLSRDDKPIMIILLGSSGWIFTVLLLCDLAVMNIIPDFVATCFALVSSILLAAGLAVYSAWDLCRSL